MRNKRIYIRATEEELEAIKSKANQAGLSVSNFIRLCVHKSEIKNRSEVKELKFQIARIGNNINQIARALNTNRLYKEKEKGELKGILSQILTQIKKAL